VISSKLAMSSALVGWILIIVGILAVGSAWRTRHPDTTADFTLFYRSAQYTDQAMFEQPPGPPRGNMNPPIFQLMVRPLTAFSIPTAAAIFRIANIAALCACIWWLARTSDERWTLADYGALLAWAPMASMIALNQLTWIVWPLLLWAWWHWRQGRWAIGAIGYGLALSLKPFLGVILLWLLVTKRWRAVAATGVTGAAAMAIGLAVYGIDVHLAWIDALGDVTWAYAGMNAALQGVLVRALSKPIPSSDPLIEAPELVGPLAALGGALFVLITLYRTRNEPVDRAWLPLMVSSLLASPLGWVYYIWWILPGNKPSHLLRESPLLWMPMVFPVILSPSPWLGLTLGSVYFWALLSLWLNRMYFDPARAIERQTVAKRSLALRAGVAAMVFVAIVIARGQFVAAKQIIEDDPVIGTWVLDRAASTLHPSANIESRTITFTAIEDTIRQTGETREGGVRKSYEACQYRYNGEDHLIRYSFLDTVAFNRIDRHTVERSGKVESQVVETETRTVSPDGGTLTIETRGIRDGVPYSAVQVFRRVS
jgi:alpha-1,2-mannosyltransferase